MYVSITEHIWQANSRGQTIQNFFIFRLLSFQRFHWESRFPAVPNASTGCQQSLEIG